MVQLIDRLSFKVVDMQVLFQGTFDRFSCKVQLIDRFSFKLVDRLVLWQGTVEIILQSTVDRQVFF